MIMMTILTELHSLRIWFYSSKIEALFFDTGYILV